MKTIVTTFLIFLGSLKISATAEIPSDASKFSIVRHVKWVEGYVAWVTHAKRLGRDFKPCDECKAVMQDFFFKSFTPELIEHAVNAQSTWRVMSLLQKATYAVRPLERFMLKELHRSGTSAMYNIRPYGIRVRLTDEEVNNLHADNSVWKDAFSRSRYRFPPIEDRQTIRLFKVRMKIVPVGRLPWQSILGFHDFDFDELPPEQKAPFALQLNSQEDQVEYLGTWVLPKL